MTDADYVDCKIGTIIKVNFLPEYVEIIVYVNS